MAPTILERFVAALPGPYWLWVLILSLGISIPGMVLGVFLDTLNPSETWSAVARVAEEEPVWRFVGRAAMEPVIPIYCFAGIWFMRRQLAAAAPSCMDVCAEGEDSWRRAFRRLPQVAPPALLMLLIFVPGLPSLPERLQTATGPAQAAWFIYIDLFFAAAGGFFIWVYAAALIGLYDLGREPLRLRPYYEDGMLGVRPLGSLSLSLSYIYFLGVGIGAISRFFSLSPSDPFLLALLLGVAALGVFLFFLPLLSVHRHMARARSDEIAKVRQRLLSLLDPVDKPGGGTNDAAGLRQSMALGAMREEVRTIPTWPIDTSVLGKLSVVALSVFTVILSQYLQILFD